ncbi:MAG TPA: hypothetical protein VFX98_01030, partial [Longimicrobiaceae bacterium]|nr:hypothetical protein [Longimicrobiaceae bacterium]
MTIPALRRALLRCALAAAACALLPEEPAAQRDTTVAAGARYRAGALRNLVVGEGYRALWTQPVRVQVLNPDTFAGGLTVLQESGGLSTEGLRLQGRDGRVYQFRSVDKNVEPSLPEDLRGTLPHAVVQDMVSAKHPAAALVVPPLLEAVGVLHAVPRLFVMPDHPFLGEHRAEFRGRLGQLEVRPTAGDEGPRFAGAADVEGSEDLLEKLEESPNDRADARAFLTARLMDVLVGDWDRHLDQWRWAGFDRGGVRVWLPIPRDRDNALVRQTGLVAAVGRQVVPMITTFGPRYGNLFGLVVHGSVLDRRILAGVERPAWDSTAAFIRARLTDRVIDDAVRRLPPEYHAVDGERIAGWLRARRDLLPQAAREYYALLATEVDVRATDAAETAEVERHADGSVEVRLRAGGGGAPYFRRRFVPGETREVRVFLHGGDDRAEATGEGPARIRVRVLGGGGDDVLAGGRGTVLYDDRGDNRF